MSPGKLTNIYSMELKTAALRFTHASAMEATRHMEERAQAGSFFPQELWTVGKCVSCLPSINPKAVYHSDKAPRI